MIPFWKKIISYLIEVPIHCTANEYHDYLKLGIKKGEFILSTKDAIYSYGKLYYNFAQLFKKLMLNSPHYDVLILGFGMGSITQILESNFEASFHYVGIEKDPDITWWVSQYVLPDIRSTVEIYNTSAEIFLQNTNRTYDLIIGDVFEGQSVPPYFLSQEYLDRVSSLLNPEGLFIQNFMDITEKQKSDFRDFNKAAVGIFPRSGKVNVHKSIFFVSDEKRIV